MFAHFRTFGRFGSSCLALGVCLSSLSCGGKGSLSDDSTGQGQTDNLGGTAGAATNSYATSGAEGGNSNTSLVAFGGTGGDGRKDDTSAVPTGSGGTANASSVADATGGVISSSATNLDCSHVTCAPIPNSCTKFIQVAGECCSTCAYNPCAGCAPLTCADGQHLETRAADCCPSCVVDPPSPCEKGQTAYATNRATLIDKYSSSGCRNSTECSIVTEKNNCAWSCGIPLPADGVNSLTHNLLSGADAACASCPPLTPIVCEQSVPACVNGKCVAAAPN